MYGLQPQECGLFLSDDGLLGASPDRVLDEGAILEVKCPYSWRDLNSIKDALTKTGGFLELDETYGYTLKKEHAYYHQVQGQLHLSKRVVCYFVTYIPKDCIVIPIRRDEIWKSAHLPALSQFVKDTLLPFIRSDSNVV
jgi:hypothetical protein